MTRRTALPSHEDLQLAIKQLTETTGKPPTVLALAGHLGLANTTFRRHFPDLADHLTQQRSTSPTGSNPAGSTPFQRLQRENTHLRSANRDLSEHLDLAIAHIQRLTLETTDSAKSSKPPPTSPASPPATAPRPKTTPAPHNPDYE